MENFKTHNPDVNSQTHYVIKETSKAKHLVANPIVRAPDRARFARTSAVRMIGAIRTVAAP